MSEHTTEPGGDVEALAEVLAAQWLLDETGEADNWYYLDADERDAVVEDSYAEGHARAVLASDWLAAHDDQVRREAWAEGVRDAAARIGVSPEGSLLDANPYARQEADR